MGERYQKPAQNFASAWAMTNGERAIPLYGFDGALYNTIVGNETNFDKEILRFFNRCQFYKTSLGREFIHKQDFFDWMVESGGVNFDKSAGIYTVGLSSFDARKQIMASDGWIYVPFVDAFFENLG